MLCMQKSFALGFIAGEGSFALKVDTTRQAGDAPVAISPVFEIHANERESETIEALASTLPVECSVYHRSDTNGAGGSVQLHCGGYTKIQPLIDWIESAQCPGFVNSDKYEAFQTFTTAVELMQDGAHLTQDGAVEILELRDEMNGAGHVDRVSADDVRALCDDYDG